MWLLGLVSLAAASAYEVRECRPPDGHVAESAMYVEFTADYAGERRKYPLGPSNDDLRDRFFVGPNGDVYAIAIWLETSVTEDMMVGVFVRFRMAKRGDWSGLSRVTKADLRSLRREQSFLLRVPVDGAGAEVVFRVYSGGHVGFWACHVHRPHAPEHSAGGVE